MADLRLVVAVAENGVIGADGDLPWRLPDELKHFRRITMGHIVLMGRKTYESLPKALDGRQMWVLSRQPRESAGGVQWFADLDTAIRAAGPQPVFVIGGASLYGACREQARVIHLTHVHASLAGDTYFDALEPEHWQQVSCERHEADSRHEHSFSMCEYQRR